MKNTYEHFLNITKFLYENQIGTKQGYILVILSNPNAIYTLAGLLKLLGGTTASVNSNLKVLRDKGFVERVLNYNGVGTYRLTADTKNALFGEPEKPKRMTFEDYSADRADRDNKIDNEQ
jgi:hypothetical protein